MIKKNIGPKIDGTYIRVDYFGLIAVLRPIMLRITPIHPNEEMTRVRKFSKGAAELAIQISVTSLMISPMSEDPDPNPIMNFPVPNLSVVSRYPPTITAIPPNAAIAART